MGRLLVSKDLFRKTERQWNMLWWILYSLYLYSSIWTGPSQKFSICGSSLQEFPNCVSTFQEFPICCSTFQEFPICGSTFQEFLICGSTFQEFPICGQHISGIPDLRLALFGKLLRKLRFLGMFSTSMNQFLGSNSSSIS